MAAQKLKIYETGMASKNKQFGRKAILDSHVYCFNRGYETLDGLRCQWICSHKGCNVTVLADNDGNIKKEPRDHLHYPPNAASREADIQVGKIKKNAKETSSKTSEVVDEVRNNVSIAILGRMPSKQSLLRQVQRSRKEELKAPANPTDFANLVIPHKFSVHQKRDSMGGAELVEERFLQSEIPVGDKKILIFARQKFMNLLEDTEDWLGDGTFKSAPKPFSQLFTVHVKWRDTHRAIPCFYILLPDKSEDTYVAMFLEIRRLVNGSAPSSFSCDFEQSLINAIIRVFPAADIRGCYFHFSQYFRHHLSDYGIQDRVDNDPAIALQARMLRGLAFVPEEDVVDAYELLLQNIDIPTWHGFLSNYFEVYYIGEPHRFGPGRDDGVFARATWNVHQRTLNGGMRTNNTLEGFNFRVNDCMQEMHPTLWKFIEKLKKLDESIYSDYIQWLDGREPTFSKRFQQMESQKLAVVRSYPNIGRMEFLRAVANRLAD